MKCTNCNTGVLSPSLIDNLFKAHTCTECGGHWVLIADYTNWKDRNPDFQFTAETVGKITESATALLCPASGIIMRKFRISAKSPHRLDYSSSVSGIWLDKGEWSLLKQEGLAGSLNTMLTTRWQNNIRLECAKETFATIYGDKFGQESYSKAREIREWLNNHPCKADLRAYLMADHPYSVK